MADRKYTYTVEIDASQAKAEAAKLRAMFDQELAGAGRPSGGAATGGPGAAIAADLRQAAPEIEKIKTEMAGLARIDASTPIEELIADLGTLDRALVDARRRMEEMQNSAGAMAGKTQQQIAEYRAYLTEVERAAGQDAARAIGSTGQYLNQGQRRAEFPTDNESAYLEFARDYHQRNQDAGNGSRQSLAAQQEAAKLEAEYYALELQVNQRQQEITRRRIAELDQALGANAGPVDVSIFEKMDDAEREIAELGEEETRLLRNIAEANDQAASLAAQQSKQIEQEAAKAARKQGGFDAGGGSTTQQVALTVTQKAVTNAQELTAAMREAAGLTDRIADSTEKITAADIGRIKSQKEAYIAQEQQRRQTEIDVKDAERRLAVEKETAKQATIAAQQSKNTEAGKTTIAKNESNERLAIARAEATQKSELAKTERINAQREYSAATAAYKKEAAERTAAQRKSSGGGGIGSALGSIGLSPQALIGGAVAGLGLYSIDQVARNVYDGARSGAQLERMATTFEQVASRVGISSDAMIASIKAASKDTITSADAMSLGAQILAQKWSSSSDDVIGDTGRLVEASRRLAQIYTDESGQFLTTQEVFARLIKYIREGNKELVDQFGVSNARIAESLGITTKGLAAAGGASDRFRGLIKVLGEDMERLGPAMLTAADKFEQSEARITAAKQRIDKALAGPVAGLTEGTAGVLEGIQIGAGGAGSDQVRDFIERQNQAYTDIGTKPRAELQKVIETFEQLDELAASGGQSVSVYREQIAALGTAMLNSGTATTEQLAALDQIQRAIGLAVSETDTYSRVMAITTEEALQQDSAMFALARTMGDYQRMYEEGKISLDQYNRLSGQLATTLFGLASAAGMLAPALAGVNAQLAAVPSAGLLGGPITGSLTQSPGWFNYRQGENQFAQDRIDAQTTRDQAARAEAKRAADAAQKEWESAAKSAASDFEKAAQSAAESFKSSLEAVPGLFGSSEVTADDMTLAKAGVYQEKADEYLRQLKDEVQNNVDRPGVDIRDAAARAGIDPNAPADVILALFEKAWNDSSLFSGGKNLDLINADAVQAELSRQQASEDGRKAILAYFGMGEDSPLGGAEQSAFSDLVGLDDQSIVDAGAASREKFLQGFSATGGGADTQAAGSNADFLAPIIQTMESGINTGDTADRIYGIGSSIAGRLYSGFTDAANNLAWGRPIIDALAASVAPQVYDMLGAELNN